MSEENFGLQHLSSALKFKNYVLLSNNNLFLYTMYRSIYRLTEKYGYKWVTIHTPSKILITKSSGLGSQTFLYSPLMLPYSGVRT